MEKYFKVVAKCGHVGRQFYYEGVFYLKSKSLSSAAQTVKNFPRVKHDHKDVIISVDEIDEQEYQEGVLAQSRNPYFNCTNLQQQSLYWDQIAPHVKLETEYQISYRKFKYEPHLKYQSENTQEMKIKKPYKRTKPRLDDYVIEDDAM